MSPETEGSNASSFVNPKYTLSDKLWKYLVDYAAKHKAKGNGFGYGLNSHNDVARTLSARYYKDGSEILIAQDGLSRMSCEEWQMHLGYHWMWQYEGWTRVAMAGWTSRSMLYSCWGIA